MLPCFSRLTLIGLLSVSALAQAAFDSAQLNKNNEPLQIQRITPDGRDVPTGRQLVFQFNRPVVPLGRMEREAGEIPITIAPKLACQWRWLNTSALACELGDKAALAPATRYRVLVQPGIKTEAGDTLEKPLSHVFITERPSVSDYSFQTWKAPGMPYVRVSFNQPVQRASVASALYFMANGKQRFAVQAEFIDDKKPEDYNSVWLVHAQQLMPENADLILHVEPGLKSQLGPENGVEKREVVSFASFPAFAFLGVQCTSNEDKELAFTSSKVILALTNRCNPLRPVGLVFSAPVIVDEIKNSLSLVPGLAEGRSDYDPWADSYRNSRLSNPHQRDNRYVTWLPELLKAWQVYQLDLDVAKLRDEFGRTLSTKKPRLQFATNHRLPEYNFEHNTAVLESNVDSQVPIVVTNLEQLNLAYHILTPQGPQFNLQTVQLIPKVPDLAFKIPLDVRRLLPGPSGVVAGQFTSQPQVNQGEDNWFFTQVTPFHVEVKAGHHNTLVWVTDLASGQPVAGVNLTLYAGTYAQLGGSADVRAQGVTDANGIAMLPGLATLDPTLSLQNYDRQEPRLFLRCQQGNALALMALDHYFAVDMYELSENYSVYTMQQKKYGHIHTWGTTAQGVYKVGDTIQYKVLVRDQSNTAFTAAPAGLYHLTVVDPMGKTVHELKDLKLSEFGSLAGEFALPKTAAVGWYDFQLRADFIDTWWSPLRVLVSDFTPSPFRVQTTLKGELFQAGDNVGLDTQASLHAGGPYAHAQTQFYALLRVGDLAAAAEPKLQSFSFDVWNRTPQPVNPAEPAPTDATEEDSEGDMEEDITGANEETIYQTEGSLNAKGEYQTEFKLPEDSKLLYGTLAIESTVRDDRGKDVAARTSARFVGRDRFVGLKATDWVLQQNKAANVLFAVIDAQGKAVAGVPVHLQIQRRDTKAARVKGAGNAYLTHYVHSWVDEAQCQEVSATDSKPCQFTPQQPGSYRVIATIKDTKGRPHITHLAQWVAGTGQVVWDTSENNRLEITPEKATYQIGDTARYLVKNPYPGAKALITIERFGVLKSWVETFEDSLKIVEFKVEPDYLPGYFLSVMVMSPRVEKPLGENQVDLGKPAFRMGYVRVDVTDPYKQLQVEVKPAQTLYKPREAVTVAIQAKPRQSDAAAEPIELAVAVLDEAVFDLIAGGLKYFDPYQGFYSLDEVDVKNYNLLLRLVGRQKFEKKGASPGGDGGRAGNLSLRSLFKFVSYWNPALRTDAQGKAEITFNVPDNLTGWRVLVMAVTPSDRMGLGEANFKVNLPLEIRPVLPNQVTVGDRFQAGFNVMNRTDVARDLKVSINAMQTSGDRQETVETVHAEPYQRYTVWLPLEAREAGPFQLNATVDDAEHHDALQKTLEVRPRRALETAAVYGTTLEKTVSENLLFPTGIYPDTGAISVTTAPSIIGGIGGAFEYMRDYPYACWEQKLSKGVMASHYTQLQAWLPEKLVWEDAKALPAQTLALAGEYQAPNGGMTYFVPTDEHVSPYLSAYTALAFTWLKDSGLSVPGPVENKLQDYLGNLLRRDILPDFYSKGMAATVRAVGLAALARAGKADLADIKRYQRYVPEMSLFGQAAFLDAALFVKGSDKISAEVAKLIVSHAQESAGKISFNETLDDSYQRILATPLRDNCAILSSLVRYEELGGKTAAGLPSKLVSFITDARKSRTHWENTQENLFCMNALIDYARVYEKDQPAMQVQAWFDNEKLGETRFNGVKNPSVVFERPITPADPGRKAQVKLDKDGPGRLYYKVQMRYASTLEKATAINAGMEITREYSVERAGQWVLLTSPMTIKAGELVRVDLYLSLPTARNFVVVDDPVPGGLEPVNRDLATASEVAANQATSDYAGGAYWFKFSDWQEYGISFWNFYHQELRHHAAIFYSDYLSPGNYHLSYVAQAVAPGEFTIMPVHAEEMYNPDIYGTGVPAVLKVEKEK